MRVTLLSLMFALLLGSHASAAPVPAPGTALAFPVGGTVAGVYVHSGQQVSKGAILVALDASDRLVLLDEAQAALDYQHDKLTQLQQLSGPANSGDAINDPEAVAKQNLMNALQDSYLKADDALRNRADQIFYNFPSQPQVSLSGIDSSTANQLASQTNVMEVLMAKWKASLDAADTADLSAIASTSISNLGTIKIFLDSVAQVVDFAHPDIVNSFATIKNMRNDIFLGRANVLAGISEIITARAKLRDAQYSAANNAIAIQLQQNVIRQSSDKVKEIQASIDHMALRAPADGVVTRVSVALGSSVKADVPVVYVRPTPPHTTALVDALSQQVASVLGPIEALFSRW